MISAAEVIHQSGIGASEIAAVMGISPFADAWEIYKRKRNQIGPKEQTEEMYWGTKLEPVIAQVFSEKMEVPVEWWNKRIYSKERAWQYATPDAFILSGPAEPNPAVRKAILECKTAGLRMSGEWDRDTDGEEGVPEYYYAQVQWQLDVCQLPGAWIAVLIAGQDYRAYFIPHDQEAIEVLLDAGDTFWRHHVMAGVEPDMSGSETARQYLKQRYPRHKEMVRLATEAEIEVLDQYAELRALLKQGTDRRKKLENQIFAAIGDGEGLEWDRGKFTWKLTKDRRFVNWKELAEDRIKTYSAQEQKDFVAKYTSTKPGYRRINFNGEDDE